MHTGPARDGGEIRILHDGLETSSLFHEDVFYLVIVLLHDGMIYM